MAPVVERLDSAIHRINPYPADKYSLEAGDFYSSLLILAACRTCVTYELSKWLITLTISASVSLYSILLSLLILAVCRTCVTYEPSKWLILVALPSVSMYHYTVLYHHFSS